MNINRYMDNKIDYCLRKPSLLTVEISQNKLECIHNMNIGSKSWNNVIVNGHIAKNEIVPIELIHSTTLKTFHPSFSSMKLVILYCKRK